MAEVVGPGGVDERVEITEIFQVLDYAEALEDVVRIAVAWHETVVGGRFDDIPNRQNRTLSALTGFMHQWPDEYAKLAQQAKMKLADELPEPAE